MNAAIFVLYCNLYLFFILYHYISLCYSLCVVYHNTLIEHKLCSVNKSMMVATACTRVSVFRCVIFEAVVT